MDVKALDWIFLVWEKPLNVKTLNAIAGFDGKVDFSWRQEGKAWVDRRLPWPVRVKEVKGNSLILMQPLRMDIASWDNVNLQLPKAFVEDIGIQNFSLLCSLAKQKSIMRN